MTGNISRGLYVNGDVATKEKKRCTAVLGRSDDVFNVAGHRIGAAEVESASVSHPAAAEAAAIGVPDPLKGETIKAFVQVRVDHVPFRCLGRGCDRTPAARTVLDHHTSSLELVASLPQTRSGKILGR